MHFSLPNASKLIWRSPNQRFCIRLEWRQAIPPVRPHKIYGVTSFFGLSPVIESSFDFYLAWSLELFAASRESIILEPQRGFGSRNLEDSIDCSRPLSVTHSTRQIVSTRISKTVLFSHNRFDIFSKLELARMWDICTANRIDSANHHYPCYRGESHAQSPVREWKGAAYHFVFSWPRTTPFCGVFGCCKSLPYCRATVQLLSVL